MPYSDESLIYGASIGAVPVEGCKGYVSASLLPDKPIEIPFIMEILEEMGERHEPI